MISSILEYAWLSHNHTYIHIIKLSSFLSFFETVVLKTISGENTVLVNVESPLGLFKSGDIALGVNNITTALFTDPKLAAEGATVLFSGMFGDLLCRNDNNSWSIVEHNVRR